MKITLIALVALIVSGCATQPQYRLTKNVSQQELQQDNAACQNQAQLIQISDWAYKGTFMEGANIQMKQNAAFENCLISKGYIKKSADSISQDSSYVQQVKTVEASLKALCDEQAYKSLYDKTSCGSREMTMQMLADKSKITKDQKKAMVAFIAADEQLSSKKNDLVQSYGSAKEKTYMSFYYSSVRPVAMINRSELLEGNITWGQFNKEKLRIKGVNETKYQEISSK